jgi:hypothetical protein
MVNGVFLPQPPSSPARSESSVHSEDTSGFDHEEQKPSELTLVRQLYEFSVDVEEKRGIRESNKEHSPTGQSFSN